MSSRISPLPVLAALLLLLAAVWLLPEADTPGWDPSPAIPVIPAATTDSTADANTAEWADIAEWANAALARPILSPSRRPASAPDTATASAELPRLSAIIVIGGTRHAIFVETGEKPQLVSEGKQIDGYRIRTVAPDRVEMLGPDGLLTLTPQSVSAPAPPTTPSQ